MSTSDIQSKVDAIYAQQVDDEMSAGRYALLFKPGAYGSAAEPLIIKVGYYTEVAGLGASPADVTINGHVDVYNRCLAPDYCIALVDFWRSVSNLTINVMGGSGCYASGNFWAVSQAAPMRRVNITGGNLTLMDYCTAGPQYASGGFIADSQTGFIINGSQQQFLVRNSSIGGWSNGVWNEVFSGVVGAPPQSFASTQYNPPPYTTLDTSPLTREKPFLYADTGVIVNGDNVTAYGLFVEHVQRYELVWNGENGRTIFFQNEMPYDVPDQAAWQHDGVDGYAAYKVAESVKAHEAWGLGSYCFFNQGVDIHSDRAFEEPNTTGVKLHDILTVFLNGSGGIDHVVNDTGAAVNSTNQVTNVVSYP